MDKIKISIYVDSPEHKELGEKCIESARKAMPHAEIWHLTNLNGPELSADKCLRLDVNGPFAWRQAIIKAQMTGDVLDIDSDVMIRQDVSHIFDDKDWEVCVTTDMKPGHETIKYNGGVIFCRNPQYWLDVAELSKDMDFGKTPDDWFPIETVRNQLAESPKFKIRVLDGWEYNYVPEGPEDMRGKLAHFRGNRKMWLFPIREFQSQLNTPSQVMLDQAVSNLKRNLPRFVELPANDGEALIVGGAPSLRDSLEIIADKKESGAVIFALNGAHDWLIERGIVPNFHVLLDARQENIRFVHNPHKDCTYLVAAQCHPSVFDALDGANVMQWVACLENPEQDQKLAGNFPGEPILMVGGGATVGLKTMNLAYLMGFRKISLFGIDSSYQNGENHAYRQSLNDGENRMEVHAAGRDFVCAPWMAKQAVEFQKQYRQLTEIGVDIEVFGDGLIPHVFAQLRNGSRPVARHSTT